MFKIGLNNGLTLGIVQILLLMVVHFTGRNPLTTQPSDLTMGIVYLLSLVAMVFFIRKAILQYRDNVNHGSISLGKAIGVGIITSLIAALIGGVFFFLYYFVIDPDTANQLKEMNRQELEKSGLEGEQLAQAERMTEMFLNPIILFVMQTFMSVFFGLIVSVIIGAIVRKD